MQALSKEQRDRLYREGLLLAVVSFPLMVMGAVALDIAFITVAFVPRLTLFLRLESIMPAYVAYRIFVEVVFEALPQV